MWENTVWIIRMFATRILSHGCTLLGDKIDATFHEESFFSIPIPPLGYRTT